MRRLNILLLMLVLLSGCETINDAIVRQWHKDSGLGRRVNYQIREGLERREGAPPARGPKFPAPAFMDEG